MRDDFENAVKTLVAQLLAKNSNKSRAALRDAAGEIIKLREIIYALEREMSELREAAKTY